MTLIPLPTPNNERCFQCKRFDTEETLYYTDTLLNNNTKVITCKWCYDYYWKDFVPQRPLNERELIEWVQSFKLSFGKHKGKTLVEIPRDYIKWMVENKILKTDSKLVERFYINNAH